MAVVESMKLLWTELSLEDKLKFLHFQIKSLSPEDLYGHADLREDMLSLLQHDVLSELPDELCLRILSYLSPAALLSVAGVSQKWRRLASDPSLWKSLEMRRFRPDSLLAGDLDDGGIVRNLYMDSLRSYSNSMFLCHQWRHGGELATFQVKIPNLREDSVMLMNEEIWLIRCCIPNISGFRVFVGDVGRNRTAFNWMIQSRQWMCHALMGRCLVTGGIDGALRLWYSTENQSDPTTIMLQTHDHSVTNIKIEKVNDGWMLASICKEYCLCISRLDFDFTCVASFSGFQLAATPMHLQWVSSGMLLIILHADPLNLHYWSEQNSAEICRYKVGHRFIDDGKGLVRKFSVCKSKIVYSVIVDHCGYNNDHFLIVNTHDFLQFYFSPEECTDKMYIEDNLLVLNNFDLVNPRNQGVRFYHLVPNQCKPVVLESSDNSLTIYDTAVENLWSREYVCAQPIINKYIFTCSRSGLVQLWDVPTGVLVRTLLNGSDRVSKCYVVASHNRLLFALISTSLCVQFYRFYFPV